MLKTVNPLVKLAVCLIWLAAAVFVFDPRFQLAVILIPVSALVLFDRVSPLRVFALMLPFALFGFGFLTTSVLFRKEADFAAFIASGQPFASPAFSAGITLFLRAIACGMVSVLFALTTDPDAFIRALMAYAKVPPRIGYALFSVLQLLPDLLAEAREIRLARAMKRGRAPRRFPGPLETASLVIPLLAHAIRRAGRTAIAMEARGLGLSRHRTIIHVPPFRGRDLAFAAGALALLVVFVAGVVLRPAS